jgi:N6-L-threonylcarbamoyladenine synthase
VVEQALRTAFQDPGSDILELLHRLTAIAVTTGPGLVGSLMIGLQAAKGLCIGSGTDLVGVNHLEAHLEAVYAVPGHCLDPCPPLHLTVEKIEPFLPPGPPCPHVALTVSGGHTLLLYVVRRGHYEVLGGTRDDAAGEAFDKVAKMLGLGYPGGVVINQLAAGGRPDRHAFPRALPARKDLDFSFSGLKTAVRLHLQKHGAPQGHQAMADFAASVQEAIVDVLVKKSRAAISARGVTHLILSGGVAANTRLRQSIYRAGLEDGFEVHMPESPLCTDNAAMVAVAGSRRWKEGRTDTLEVDATARQVPGRG